MRVGQSDRPRRSVVQLIELVVLELFFVLELVVFQLVVVFLELIVIVELVFVVFELVVVLRLVQLVVGKPPRRPVGINRGQRRSHGVPPRLVRFPRIVQFRTRHRSRPRERPDPRPLNFR
jgi:hypothetical protein